MIVYEICAVVEEEGAVLRWAGSKFSANEEREAFIQRYNGKCAPTIKRIFIPTHNKTAFLRWLNNNLSHDNM